MRQAEQELLTRQQAERLALHAAQKTEGEGFFFRMRVTVVDLIRSAPGLRSVLGHIQKLTHLDPQERHRLESEALARRHGREKPDIERRKRTLARLETREKQSLEKELRLEQRLQEAARLEAAKLRAVDNKAMQDFQAAAHDQGLWRQREFNEGELSQTFNDEAGFIEGAHESGDDDDRAPDWKQRTEKRARGHRPRRGKGHGYRRGSD